MVFIVFVRFIKEVRLLNEANYSHVVRIEGYTSWRSSMAIVMEYLPGGNLHDLLLSKNEDDDNHRYDISSALKLRFSADISSGITYLHNGFNDKRMVHGDLKPANILLTSDLRCKVGDFGGAEFATCFEYASFHMSRMGGGERTRGFTAPEKLPHQRGSLLKSMDVYSYGVIIYVIIQRRNPSPEFDVFTASLNLCRQNYETNADPIVQLLLKHMKNCCDKDPQKRPLMINVRDELQLESRSQNLAAITREVADILDKKSIEIPHLRVKECKSLNELRDHLSN